MTENQNKILKFFKENVNVKYSISDIQYACFGRPLSRRRGFGNIQAINSMKKYIAYESPKNRIKK